MHVSGLPVGWEEGAGKRHLLQRLSVVVGSACREEAGIAPHAFVEDEHARVGGGLADDVGEEDGSLSCCGVSTEGLLDRDDVVVDGLGHADDRDLAPVLLQQVLGKDRGLGVGVVPADGVDNVDIVSQQRLGCDLERRAALLDVSALDAVGDVGQLHTRVSDWRSSDHVECLHGGPFGLWDDEGVTGEQPTVSVSVESEGQSGDDPGLVGFDPVLCEVADAGAEAWCETTGREHGHVDMLSLEGEICCCVGRHV
mmetsp:Transcript_25651/g.71701  ORF Transcript_25651/g.71701 Transcript_25651/m.71701 type:complete len:254 (-) Transcript_25651:741-1502(-)